MRRTCEAVEIIANVDKGFGSQYFVNVGFCLKSLSPICPSKVEQSHMYFRLERLFPGQREIILGAGRLDEQDQERWLSLLCSFIRYDVAARFSALESEAGLRAAWTKGLFVNGLVTTEARQHFESGQDLKHS